MKRDANGNPYVIYRYRSGELAPRSVVTLAQVIRDERCDVYSRDGRLVNKAGKPHDPESLDAALGDIRILSATKPERYQLLADLLARPELVDR